MEFLGSSSTKDSSLEKGNQGKWTKLNVDQTGFFRVKYDDELSARLICAIEAKYLSITDRFGILDDSFSLSMACKQSLSSLFALLSAYREEDEYIVLSRLISVSDKVAKIVFDATPELSDYVKQFFINLFQNSAEKLGWDPRKGESHLDAMLRGEVLTALVSFGHNITQNEAIRRFHAFVDDRNTTLLPPDTRKTAYIAVMQTVSSSNRSGYESLLKIYRETDMSQEKARVLATLTSCPDLDIVLEALNFLFSSEVRSQDAAYGLSISREGRETAWGWLKDNWDQIMKIYGSGFLVTHFIEDTILPLSSYEKAAEVEEFFASRTKPSFARTLKQSLEQVKINANWIQSVRDEKSLAEVIKESSYKKY